MGQVGPGGLNAHPAPIDASAVRAAFVLFWTGEQNPSTLRLTLQAPSGAIIDASGPGITYTPAREMEGAFMVESYDVEAPDAGEWLMRVEAVSVPPAGQPYIVTAGMNSPVTLGTSVSAGSVLQGDPIGITAHLQEGGLPISGADVNVSVVKPDASAVNVILRDDGFGGDPQPNDGNYFGTLSDTSVCGLYSLEFHASGIATSGPFGREAIASMDARVQGDALGDPCNADEDGDSFGRTSAGLALFSDEREFALGTNPGRACARDATGNNEEPDPQPEDFNDDGSVTGFDLSAVAGVIGQTVPPAPVRRDLNLDGAIAGADLSLVAGRIGLVCVPPGPAG